MQLHKKKFKSAFSLVEVVIILLIVSIATTAVIGFTPKKDYEKAEKITIQNLDKIERALLAFYNINGFLPCPASLTATGVSIGTASDCAAGAIGGTFDFTTGTDVVRNGMVPGRQLSLPPETLIDGWGNRIVYSLPTNLGQTSTLFNTTNTSTAISVMDFGGGIINGNNVGYFLSAPGSNHRGAYSIAGSQIIACSGGSDFENCDFNGNFMDRALDLSLVTPVFDDYVRWKTIKEIRKFGDYTGSGGGAVIKYGQWLNQGPAVPTGGGFGAGPAQNFVQIYNTADATLISFFGTNDTITLSRGKYIVKGTAMGCDVGYVSAILYDGITGNAYGGGAIPQDAPVGSCNRVIAQAYIDVPAATTRNVTLYPNFGFANGVDGTGRNGSVGFPYFYASIEIWQISTED